MEIADHLQKQVIAVQGLYPSTWLIVTNIKSDDDFQMCSAKYSFDETDSTLNNYIWLKKKKDWKVLVNIRYNAFI